MGYRGKAPKVTKIENPTASEINLQLEEKEQQITDISYNPKNFNCKLDGTTDDSVNLQAFFDNPIVKGKVKFPPNSQLLLNTPIYINKDNLEIDLNGCQIKWGSTTDLGASNASSRNIGIFNLKKASETVIGTPINCVPKIVNNYGANGTVHAGRYYAKVTLPSAPIGLSVGDWIRVAMNVSGTQVATALIPYFNVIAKCVKINGNDVYFDYFNPFVFDGATYSFARIYKITPRHNVKIKNASFQDLNTWDYRTDDISLVPQSVLQKCISFIYGEGIVDCEFDNIYGLNTTNPIIALVMAAYCKIKNIEVDRPAITCPGRGYGVQIGSSTQMEVSNVRGLYARHCVDFDNCSFSNAKRINGRYMFATSFMTHGCYDHDLLFEDCEGSCSLEAGTSFGAATKNITFKRCYINEFNVGYSPDLKFYDCEVTIVPTSENVDFPDYWSRVEFHNSKVSLLAGNWKAITKTGETNLKTKMIFNHCEVNFLTWTAAGTNSNPKFQTFDDVIFINCDLKMQSNIDNSTITYVTIENIKNIKITGGKVRGVYFFINPLADLYIDFEGFELLDYNVPSGNTYPFVDLNYNTFKQTIKYHRLKVVYSGLGTLRMLRTGGTVPNTLNQKFVCTGGYFKSMTTNLVSFYIPISSGVPTNNTHMSSNIFANVNKEGFTTADFPNNMWVTE